MSHHSRSAVVLVLAVASFSCSQSGNGGAVQLQTGIVGSDGRCPVDGGMTDADAMFTHFAGTYTLTPNFVTSGCSIDPPADLNEGQTYTLTLGANPKRVSVQTNSGTRDFVWDGQLDFTCASDYVSTLQIGSDRDMVRVNFMFDDSPLSALVGACMGKMTP